MKISQILPKANSPERKNYTQQEYASHFNTQPEGVTEVKKRGFRGGTSLLTLTEGIPRACGVVAQRLLGAQRLSTLGNRSEHGAHRLCGALILGRIMSIPIHTSRFIQTKALAISHILCFITVHVLQTNKPTQMFFFFFKINLWSFQYICPASINCAYQNSDVTWASWYRLKSPSIRSLHTVPLCGKPPVTGCFPHKESWMRKTLSAMTSSLSDKYAHSFCYVEDLLPVHNKHTVFLCFLVLCFGLLYYQIFSASLEKFNHILQCWFLG